MTQPLVGRWVAAPLGRSALDVLLLSFAFYPVRGFPACSRRVEL